MSEVELAENMDEECNPSTLSEIWLKLRRNTLIIFFIQNLFVGLDCSFTYLTLWLYLKKLTNSETPYFFYNLISVSLFIPSIFLTGFIASYIDRTRNVRIACFIINTLVILGNILYILPYSPWLLAFSRLLIGFGNVTRSIMNGEVSRSYPRQILSTKLSVLGMGYNLGFIAGPALNLLCFNITFRIKTLTISYLNIPGLYMAILYLLQQLASFCFLSDLSKVYDLKAESAKSQCNEEAHLIERDSNETSSDDANNKYPKLVRLWKVLSNVDIALLLVITFLQNYLNACMLMWRSLIIIERLQWSGKALGYVNTAEAVALLFPLVLLTRISLTLRLQFIFGLLSLFAYLISQSIELFQYYVKHTIINVIAWVIYSLTGIITGIANEIFVVGVLAQMVSSRHQVFLDGIRFITYRLGAVVAIIFSSLEFQVLAVFVPLHCFILLVCACLLVHRRRTIQNPTVKF